MGTKFIVQSGFYWTQVQCLAKWTLRQSGAVSKWQMTPGGVIAHDFCTTLCQPPVFATESVSWKLNSKHCNYKHKVIANTNENDRIHIYLLSFIHLHLLRALLICNNFPGDAVLLRWSRPARSCGVNHQNYSFCS